MIQTNASQNMESLVFVQEVKQVLRYHPVIKGSVQVRSHADVMHADNVIYKENVDYVVDYASGRICRITGSRIADWANHVLYGEINFDHTLYPDYSNNRYTVYADYKYEDSGGLAPGHMPLRGLGDKVFLQRVRAKLEQGKAVKYVVYGDSISTGAEASEDRFAYTHQFAEKLAEQYPMGKIRLVNKAIGGETSRGGAMRIEQAVVAENPDLVTIGYGMNDQNKLVPEEILLDEFERNIRFMIKSILDQTDSEIVLVTPCIPNPLWKHASGRIDDYAGVLRKLGVEYGIGVADAHLVWRQEIKAGKTYESLLLNNINHPNDYGHWLYSKAFESIL